MTTELVIAKSSAALAGLERLEGRVRGILSRLLSQMEHISIRASWEIGREIQKHLKIRGGKAEYGKQVMATLSQRLEISADKLQRSARFTEQFPDWKKIQAILPESPGRSQAASKKGRGKGIGWSHFLTLLPVEDDQTRFHLAEEAAQNGWTVEQLKRKVDQEVRPEKRSRGASTQGAHRDALLVPRIGKLYTCRILAPAEAGWPDRGRLLIDHGFRAYRELDLSLSRRFKAGEIVEINEPGPGARLWEVHKSKRVEKDRYFYRAYVVKAIDGDTFWAAIDAGASWIEKQKIRLRGVDAPEIKTAAGRRSSRFVQSLLSPGFSLFIRTSVSPNFDRYVADVFIPATEAIRAAVERTQPQGIPSQLETLEGQLFYFLNNLLLERRLAAKESH